MPQWIALSDGWLSAEARRAGPEDRLEAGALIFDLILPLPGVARLLAPTPGADRGMTLFADPSGGLCLIHRRGTSLSRYMLPGPLPMGTGPAALRFDWASDGRWGLTLTPQGAAPARVAGQGVMPMLLADLRKLCRDVADRECHPALRWFGVAGAGTAPAAAAGAAPVPAAPRPVPLALAAPAQAQGPWIGRAMLVDTPLGPRPAGQLRPGDLVRLAGGGSDALVQVDACDLPTRGLAVPLRLRTPYYGVRADLVVSPEMQIVLGGSEVEYLFGEDEVVVPARLLADASHVLPETRRPILPAVGLRLARPGALVVNGCRLLSVAEGGDGRRVLDRHEAMSLRALRFAADGVTAA